MLSYLFPLLSLILSFLATLACLRFLLSRQFFFWVLPLSFSTLLCVVNFCYVFFPSLLSLFTVESLSLVLFLISTIWYCIVIYFHYIIKKAIGKNKVQSDSVKNYNEALFLEKIERRRYIKYDKIIRDKEKYSAKEPVIYRKNDNWCDLFDNR